MTADPARPPGRLATIAEAARYLGRDRSTLDRWRRQNYGPPIVRVGPGQGRVRYRWEGPDGLEAFKAQMEAERLTGRAAG